MNISNSVRDLFFQEAEDLLKDLSQGLGAIAQGERDPEVLNVVFRAVHSLKGGGSAFGFNDLVGFSHVCEVLINQVRSGIYELDSDILHLLAQSRDVLTNLVRAARDETEVDVDLVNTTKAALEVLLGDSGTVQEEFTFEAILGDFDFESDPMFVDAAPQTFKIRFAPKRDLYATGNEPLVLIQALQELGQTDVSADLTRLTDFEKFDWEDSYLVWNITLNTEGSEYDVREIFEFVDELCDLTIETEQPELTKKTGVPNQ